MALVDEWCKDLPDVNDTDAFQLPEQSTIYANDYDPSTGTGTVLAELYLEKREPLSSLDEVGTYVTQGTVATEDVRFYEHKGVDLQGIVRAFFVNLAGGQEGASTITQQYVRNTIIADEMTDISIKRKVREIDLAVKLEQIYSKDEILLMYLNTINYGDGCHGIEAAAQHYYSKHSNELTIAQAATLIGIPNSPTLYNPVTNPESSIQRRNVVLSRMLTNGVITEDEYNAAIAEELNLNVAPEEGTNGVYKYEWFTTYVRDLLQSDEYLAKGVTYDKLFEGGLTIVTSLDPTMQEYAEEAVAIQYESGAVKQGQEFALTLVDPNTGFIKAMIGGKNFYEGDQLNIATSSDGRQIGSTAKAFTLADAIEKGINPATRINCDRGPVKVNGASIYNYGQQNYGTLSIADAIAVSSNTGFVRLSYVDSEKSGVTPESIVAMQERLGLRGGKLVNYPTADKLPAVATTTLGVGQANTTEMASAFGTFAAEGVHHDATAILTVTDRNGNELVNNTNQKGEQVLSKSVAYAVTQTLEGVIYKSMGTASAAALSSGQIAAGKTGTTDNWHDLWFVGYTPQLSCAVWTGDRSNQLELYTDSWCQEIWRYVMEHALEGVPNQEFAPAPEPDYTNSFGGSHPLRKKMRKTKKTRRMRTRSPVILPTAAPPIRPRTNRATTTPRAIRERPAPRLAPRPTPPLLRTPSRRLTRSPLRTPSRRLTRSPLRTPSRRLARSMRDSRHTKILSLSPIGRPPRFRRCAKALASIGFDTSPRRSESSRARFSLFPGKHPSSRRTRVKAFFEIAIVLS